GQPGPLHAAGAGAGLEPALRVAPGGVAHSAAVAQAGRGDAGGGRLAALLLGLGAVLRALVSLHERRAFPDSRITGRRRFATTVGEIPLSLAREHRRPAGCA